MFANVVLADEINRAPAKVQSALLEVMAERHVSIGGVTYLAPDPFLVLATQNPIESEGVYPLPEAQRDRFLMKVLVGYPDPPRRSRDRPAHERAPAVGRVRHPARPAHRAAGGGRRRVRARRGARLRRAARARDPRAGRARASPSSARSSRTAPARARRSACSSTGRALALLRGRRYLLPQDVYDVGRDVLRHRVLLTYEALADGVDVEAIVERIMRTVVAPPRHADPGRHASRRSRR